MHASFQISYPLSVTCSNERLPSTHPAKPVLPTGILFLRERYHTLQFKPLTIRSFSLFSHSIYHPGVGFQYYPYSATILVPAQIIWCLNNNHNPPTSFSMFSVSSPQPNLHCYDRRIENSNCLVLILFLLFSKTFALMALPLEGPTMPLPN